MALPATNQFNFQSGKGFRKDDKKFDFKKKDDRKVEDSMDMSKKLDFRKGGDLEHLKKVLEKNRHREIIDTSFLL